MEKSDVIFILECFFIWRIGIIIISLFSVKYLPVYSTNFFGGSYPAYNLNPLFWGNLNFDGQHYLALAQNGYQPLTYFFFPLFPLIIKTISLSKDVLSLAWTGLIISNIAFLISLFGTYKLIILDYKRNIAKLTTILLLTFPTSFYFGAYYSESIFFALAVWAFYFIRTKRLILGSIVAGISSASRIVGIAFIATFLFEFFISYRPKNFGRFAEDIMSIILISPFGIFIYMYYLFQNTGDPLIFLHQVSIYGEQRSSHLILLPQVLYRYIFKILPALNPTNFVNTFPTILEFTIGILFFALIIYGIFKLRISYSIYALIVYIIPTLSGSFSSMPRYVLVIFPAFITAAILIEKLPKIFKIPIFFVMLTLMVVTTSLFWRGYWIS